MAKGLNVFIDFVGNTAKYDRAQAKVEKSMSRLDALDQKQANERLKEAAALEALEAKNVSLRAKSDALEAKAEKASISRKKEIRKQLSEIGAQIEANEAKLERMNKANEANEIARLGSRKKVLADESAAKVELADAAKTKKIGRLVAGGIGMSGAFGFAMHKYLDKLDGLANRAKDLNISASAMQELSHQAALAGVSAEKLDSALKHVALNANGDTRAAMIALAKQVEAGTLSVSDAQKMFGDNALEMMRILEQGSDAVGKMFDANGIEDAAAAAREYKQAIEEVSNFAGKVMGRTAGALQLTKEALTSLFSGQSVEHETMLRQQKELNRQVELRKIKDAKARAEQERERAEQEAAEKAAFEKNIAYVEELDEQLAKSRKKELSDNQQLLQSTKRIADLKQELTGYERGYAEYTETYKDLVAETLKLERAEANIAKKKSAELKTQQDSLKQMQAVQEQQRTSREKFELQLKIKRLEANGQNREAEALKFAIERNSLMEKYGYSIEEATKRQKELNALQNPKAADFSEKARSVAERIVKRGVGGSVSQEQLEDAQAVVDGKMPEHGFKTGLFKRLSLTSNAPTANPLSGFIEADINKPASGFGTWSIWGKDQQLKSPKIDARAEKSKLDDDAKKIEKENAAKISSISKTSSDIQKTLQDIRNYVGGLSGNINLKNGDAK